MRLVRLAAVLGDLGTVYRERIVEIQLFNTFGRLSWKDLIPSSPADANAARNLGKVSAKLPELHAYLAPEVANFSQGIRLAHMHRPTKTKEEIRELIVELHLLLRSTDEFFEFAVELAEVVEQHLDHLPERYVYVDVLKKRLNIEKKTVKIAKQSVKIAKQSVKIAKQSVEMAKQSVEMAEDVAKKP